MKNKKKDRVKPLIEIQTQKGLQRNENEEELNSEEIAEIKMLIPILQKKINKSYESLDIFNAETAEIHNALGCLYFIINEYEKSERLLMLSFSIYKELYGLENNETASTLGYLAVSKLTQGQLEESERLMNKTFQIYKKHNYKESHDTNVFRIYFPNIWL